MAACRVCAALAAVPVASRRGCCSLARAGVGGSPGGAAHGRPAAVGAACAEKRRSLTPGGSRSKQPRTAKRSSTGSIRHGQTPRLRELLWDPLALAALNQPPEAAASATFARVLAEMFGPDPRVGGNRAADPSAASDVRGACPRVHRTAWRVGSHWRAGAHSRRRCRGRRQSTRGAESWSAPAVICAVPWHALPDTFDGDVRPLQETLDAARGTAASPIVTVNVWFDRVVWTSRLSGFPAG